MAEMPYVVVTDTRKVATNDTADADDRPDVVNGPGAGLKVRFVPLAREMTFADNGEAQTIDDIIGYYNGAAVLCRYPILDSNGDTTGYGPAGASLPDLTSDVWVAPFNPEQASWSVIFEGFVLPNAGIYVPRSGNIAPGFNGKYDLGRLLPAAVINGVPVVQGRPGKSVAGFNQTAVNEGEFLLEDGTSLGEFEVTPGTYDPAVAGFFADKTSATRAEAAKVGPAEVNVAAYGVRPDRTAAENDAGLAALFADYAGGVMLAFPARGVYQFSAPLPTRANLGLRGTGWDTVLRWIAGSMLIYLPSTNSLRVESIAIEGAATASHLIDLPTGGGLNFVRFNDVDMKINNPDASLIRGRGDFNLIDAKFYGCRLWRTLNHTVPAIDLRGTGAGINTVRFEGGWWHSRGCTTSPFLRAEIESGQSFVSKFGIIAVIGEQNMGGMAHFYSANACEVIQCVDHDALGTYLDDLFKFSSTGAGSSRGVTFRSSGTSAIATFAAGKAHLRDESTFSDVGHIVNGGNLGTRTESNAVGRQVRHGGGAARATRFTAADYTVQASDDLIIVSSTQARTLTLPNPSATLTSGTIPVGRSWRVKNRGAGAVTVVAAGGVLIDGAASVALATNERAEFVSDGTNYVRL